MEPNPENVSLLAMITSSAFIGAAANIAWGEIAKWIDRRRENKKEEGKIAHVYHAIILQLEGFAHQCNGQLYDISVAMDNYRNLQDGSAFDRVGAQRFEFNPEPEWTSLPVPFVDEMKSFINRSGQSDKWISAQFGLWAGLDDVFELEEQRMAYYALRACALASGIRAKIKIGKSDLQDLLEHFRSVIDRYRDHYNENEGRANLIPELRAQFESGLPHRGGPSL